MIANICLVSCRLIYVHKCQLSFKRKLSFGSCEVLKVSPQDSDCSWNVLALDKNDILAGNLVLVYDY